MSRFLLPPPGSRLSDLLGYTATLSGSATRREQQRTAMILEDGCLTAKNHPRKQNHKYCSRMVFDFVFCLGGRYENSRSDQAVSAVALVLTVPDCPYVSLVKKVSRTLNVRVAKTNR